MMTPGDRYRVMAGDFAALARADSDLPVQAEYQKLSLAYLRLADQADRNSETDLLNETAPAQQQQAQQQRQAQQQQQAQPQQTRPDKD